MRFWFLATRHDARLLSHVYLFITCFLAVASLGIAAGFCSMNLVFPSLGPTIFMQFYAPSSPMSSPKNTVLGHALGCLVGLFFYWLTLNVGDTPGSITVANIAILGAAVGTCGTLMGLTGLLHPPAASTTLLIVFGYLGSLVNVVAFLLAAVLVSAEAWLVHKMAGVRFPMWAPESRDTGPKLETKLGRLDLASMDDSLTVEEIASRLASRQSIK